MIETLLLSLDMIGVVSCSIAATILALRKGLDVFGALLIAVVASLGGGTIRDLLLNNHPIFWMTQKHYLPVVFISAVVTLVFHKTFASIEKPLRVFDALGLSAFTVIGVEVALQSGASSLVAVIMGITTATVGGIMRDIICNEIPLVLHKEIYITASLLGGISFLVLQYFKVPQEIVYVLTLVSTFAIRMVAIHKDLRLPRYH